MEKNKLFDIDVNEKYIETTYIKNITKRVLKYINIGTPIHLRGAAGIGKTSLAFHVAKKIGRPIIFVSGSEGFNEEDLLGGYNGVKITSIADNYISSVFKREEHLKKMWLDGKLVTACKMGCTFIYDEFTRTKPEINNVLLPVLEEKMINISKAYLGNSYMKINPDFRIIFTSNPEEYVGVYKSANALMDRMITVDMIDVDTETEIAVLQSRIGIDKNRANKIVELTRFIRSFSKNNTWVSLRSSIMLAEIVKKFNIEMSPSNDLFVEMCKDVYNSSSIASSTIFEEKEKFHELIDKAISHVLNH